MRSIFRVLDIGGKKRAEYPKEEEEVEEKKKTGAKKQWDAADEGEDEDAGDREREENARAKVILHRGNFFLSERDERKATCVRGHVDSYYISRTLYQNGRKGGLSGLHERAHQEENTKMSRPRRVRRQEYDARKR
ncbi:hypothetical protein MGYG_08948 [Nannizzia gypsea CBS 118893]|uniref:Uncharacterized protein n=1 Tax=Arthroderma gypseum (strain ATCC MYA-4604 / CBS 118893) TaxID=535722 RepID=E5R3F9_ARTGP|nr:hypothetical protein MGYG_08948 [Nannizzia gypsea CBS 118893]EFQ98758.1 hypothetical protein MGYG_08948 [Nannizzia gypsea CBS 118893]